LVAPSSSRRGVYKNLENVCRDHRGGRVLAPWTVSRSDTTPRGRASGTCDRRGKGYKSHSAIPLPKSLVQHLMIDLPQLISKLCQLPPDGHWSKWASRRFRGVSVLEVGRTRLIRSMVTAHSQGGDRVSCRGRQTGPCSPRTGFQRSSSRPPSRRKQIPLPISPWLQSASISMSRQSSKPQIFDRPSLSLSSTNRTHRKTRVLEICQTPSSGRSACSPRRLLLWPPPRTQTSTLGTTKRPGFVDRRCPVIRHEPQDCVYNF